MFIVQCTMFIFFVTLQHICGNISVVIALASHAEGRVFDPRLPLH